MEKTLLLLKGFCCADEVAIESLLQSTDYRELIERKARALCARFRLTRTIELDVEERHDTREILRMVRSLTAGACLVWDIRYPLYSLTTFEKICTQARVACAVKRTSQNPWNIALRSEQDGKTEFATERKVGDDGRRRQEFPGLAWFAGILAIDAIESSGGNGEIVAVNAAADECLDISTFPTLYLYETLFCGSIDGDIQSEVD